MWKNKKILVTGSSGMIGQELIKQLKELKADVETADIKENIDLTNFELCKICCEDIDFVFHLAGIKGTPQRTKERPADFMKMLQFDVNMIYAAQERDIKRFLYTSSIAVENMESDLYPAWAKLTAERLIEAMRIQYPDGCKYCIVRPANVFGKEDLNQEYLMVVSKLIKEALTTNKIVLDKQGSQQERDIIHARDVAKGMIKAMEELPINPVNLCSGKGIKVYDIAKEILKNTNCIIEEKDLNLVLGPDKKVMSNPYIKPEVSLEEGIKEIIDGRDT